MLNTALYTSLVVRFGDVKIVNPDQPMSGEYEYDPIHDRKTLSIHDWGESYCVSCPYCGDTRQRLYVSHRFGIHDSNTSSNNLRFLRCFNEECFKKVPERRLMFRDQIFGMSNMNSRGPSHSLCVPSVKEAPSTPQIIGWPGAMISLPNLPADHPAIMYLRSRGFDPHILAERYGIQWCERAKPGFRQAEHRIIIPVFKDGVMVGWQGRWPGELDWKKTGILKYYTSPHMPRRMLIYNGDLAMTRHFLVIVEGPMSAWPLYPVGCASMGKSLSYYQILNLSEYGKSHSIVVLLDPDAREEANKLTERLKKVSSHVANVVLPDGKDPGSYATDQDELWYHIVSQCEMQSVPLE